MNIEFCDVYYFGKIMEIMIVLIEILDGKRGWDEIYGVEEIDP